MSYLRHLNSLACSLIFISFFSWADNEYSSSTRQVNIPFTTGAITVDGEINEPLWQQAKVIELNLVTNPWDNTPSPVKTTARIIENGQYLFIAFNAQDNNPADIKAFLGDRDSRLSDDVVGIKLDTFNKRRLNYEFYVNPYGVQYDGIYNEMTGNNNDAWDGIWDAYGKITDEGYQVEIAIPYSILNFEESNQEKTWAFELVRYLPRDALLRISHLSMDRNNECLLCQAAELKGFEKAETGNNLMLTPTLVANKRESRDVYNPNAQWQGESDIEAGLDVRWNINNNTLLNATINPDFSTVETDASQLTINETFSLYYQEKRPFFLDNADYFSSYLDLVYTRNIVAPDFGAKLTSSVDEHNIGIFITKDSETNFIMPGNIGSNIAELNQSSLSSAINYRFDASEQLSIGTLVTSRSADNYHNYTAGLDVKYKFDDSNTLIAQHVFSDTKYPQDLYQQFCNGDTDQDCLPVRNEECSLAYCPYNEQVLRAKKSDSFNDNASFVKYEHYSENWQYALEHKRFGADFRADLGFFNKIDFKQNKATIDRVFWGDEDSTWQYMQASAKYWLSHNENGELLDKTVELSYLMQGPMQSELEFTATYSDKVGRRHNASNLAIDENTSRFEEALYKVYGSIEPVGEILLEAEYIFGDKIDYRNNRLADYQEIYAAMDIHINEHLRAKAYYINASMDAEGAEVYTEQLTEARISYQFDVRSYVDINIVYSDIDNNVNNNPLSYPLRKSDNLSTQVIYAYKINPQTVWYAGYADNSYQDEYVDDMTRDSRTYFTKISYAWM